jgi:hypothetical protein
MPPGPVSAPREHLLTSRVRPDGNSPRPRRRVTRAVRTQRPWHRRAARSASPDSGIRRTRAHCRVWTPRLLRASRTHATRPTRRHAQQATPAAQRKPHLRRQQAQRLDVHPARPRSPFTTPEEKCVKPARSRTSARPAAGIRRRQTHGSLAAHRTVWTTASDELRQHVC